MVLTKRNDIFVAQAFAQRIIPVEWIDLSQQLTRFRLTPGKVFVILQPTFYSLTTSWWNI
jgi:hypothetical protein